MNPQYFLNLLQEHYREPVEGLCDRLVWKLICQQSEITAEWCRWQTTSLASDVAITGIYLQPSEREAHSIIKYHSHPTHKDFLKFYFSMLFSWFLNLHCYLSGDIFRC